MTEELVNGDIIIRREGTVGHISLNRPKALHALNTGMCRTMIEALLQWRDDEGIEVVLLDHAEGRGFCAGGDIRMLAESGKEDGRLAREFFHAEYQLNHLLFTYPKPVVAFMDGVTMGGGVGISQPAAVRIATENTRFAMPETGIGLFPDVGGGWYLSRLPGQVGTWLALTGARLGPADCLRLGIATHYFPSDRLADAKAGIIAAPRRLPSILAALNADPGPAPVGEEKASIDRLFVGDSVEGIMASLRADGSDWATAQADVLGSKSPQSCKVSLRLVREGFAKASFAEEMAQEYALGGRIVQTHDFIEGVRALIVDKDNAPQWKPATLEEVSEDQLDRLFAPLDAADEWKPLTT